MSNGDQDRLYTRDQYIAFGAKCARGAALLKAENARLREALANVHEGAARQLAEPRNHDDDQFALTSICTVAEAALAGKEQENG